MRYNVRHFLELLVAMTERELRARYKRTVFGFFWLVANPILQMLVIGFVFRFFMKSPIPNYNYYLFLGLLIWNFFSLSLTKATPSIVFERNLIKKANFPHAVIPLSIVVSNLVHLLAAFLLFLIPVVFLKTFTIWTIPATISAFVLLLAFTCGFSLLSSALNVRFRDINFFVQAILIVWFYATPIIYTFSFIPYKFIWLWRFNPMVSILQLFQFGILNFPLPGIGMLTANIVYIIILLTIGIFVFRRESKYFDDWL